MMPPTPPSSPPVPPARHSAPSADPSSMKPPAMPSGRASGPAEVALSTVNINTASANDMVLFLGLSKDMVERVIVNRPYRLKGELVAKNILPKATFDSIRDKISVGQ